MDDARRSELIARRAALRVENARKDALAQLGEVPAKLDAAGAAYRIHYPGDPAAPDWHQDLVPMGFSHLDWTKVAPTLDETLDWDGFDVATLPIVRAFVAARAAPDGRVLVVSSNGATPIMEVTAAALSVHLPTLLRIDPFELWISGQGWLLELRHPHVRGTG